ncbi:hypothetical protein CDD80_3844 [Ophiocordyceps camponoti-rufipedis]|uniref:Uncharacterized protein n=1 Tax=Ophiocordyceps camponoti-rufipedis TaxID=2004952 RepID=A0A2C5YV20_9HYPO|nr:hypothetical protein CDD80_3844 [Ophiocordyceps camponoti-rufipedis]
MHTQPASHDEAPNMPLLVARKAARKSGPASTGKRRSAVTRPHLDASPRPLTRKRPDNPPRQANGTSHHTPVRQPVRKPTISPHLTIPTHEDSQPKYPTPAKCSVTGAKPPAKIPPP